MFSGAGGLSHGFKMAGFNIEFTVEIEKSYCETYRYNNPNCVCLNKDITVLDLEEISINFIKNKNIKGIIGGPPCQGFSSIGYRKIDDSRNSLIYYFIKWVDYFKPEFYLMENVPGILTMSNGRIVDKIKKMCKDIGYTCNVKNLNAIDYGVPQLRERVFFIGTKDGRLKNIKIAKTNREKTEGRPLFETKSLKYLPSYLNVIDAISDILNIEPFKVNNKYISFKEYNNPPKTEYEKYLRKNSDKLYDHIVPNHSKLVMERISHINQGKNHSSLPKKYRLRGGYSNIYGRLHINKPADAITGNCGCVSAPGRFIHPTKNRAISVREASRLQSFPDDYRFFGNMNDKYRQVGNSIPPLLSYVIAKAIRNTLHL